MENALPHWELAAQYDLIDFDLGTLVPDSRFIRKGAKLQRALIQYFWTNTAAGYTEFQVPHLVNEESIRTGHCSTRKVRCITSLKTDSTLIPTAEVILTNLLRNQLIEAKTCPLKDCGYTPVSGEKLEVMAPMSGDSTDFINLIR